MINNDLITTVNDAIKTEMLNGKEKLAKLKEDVNEIKNNRHPSHAISVQWDSKFEIDVLYKDGKSEHIFSTEAIGFVCKYLNSKGSSGDSGYRIGKIK